MSVDRRHVAPILVLIVLFLITAVATKYVWDSSLLADENRFDLTVRSTVDTIEDRIEVYSNVLRAAAGLFAAQQDVTRDQFRAYVRNLNVQSRYPGVLGVGVSIRVKEDMLPDVIADVRANDFPDFHVWPGNPRSEYHTIVVLEPLTSRNRTVIGYDMYTSPVRRAAMDQARDTGEPAATGKVTLIQEAGQDPKQPGFVLYVPVYTTERVPKTVEERRSALYGFVYAPFRAGDFLRGTLGKQMPDDLGFSIFDGPDELFANDKSGIPNRPRFTATRPIHIGGRTWTVRFAARHAMGGAPLRNAAGTAASGLVLSLLIFALLRGQLAAQAQAEQTAETLRKSETELLAASRAKDEFLATLSHELRTPMTAILGWSQLLGEPLDPDSLATAVDSIQKSSRAQAQLIDDLLDVSRITSGKMRIDPRPIDLPPVIDAAVGAVSPAAEAKNVRIEVEQDGAQIRVNGDASRLQQVFWNLLSNAVKFTPRGGSIRVESSVDGSDAVVKIVDTGEGIDPAFLPHVFERFRQADSSTTRAYSGLGLGLAIVRHLIELHGGTVEAFSDGLGKGARFTVRLPVLAVRHVARDAELRDDSEALAALSGAKVLFVDDDDEVRKYAATVFRTTGAEARCVDSAAEALRTLEDWIPHVIVTDIGMPGMDGYALLRRIRVKLNTVPVLAITAYARPEDRERAERAGFDGFIAKPVDPRQLRATVAAVLNSVA